ncbi:hypothetical protein [Ekhidna sp.]|uniref:hypothetical protein n=1 Tax=Ekhidna sp. TaxID=2608089 RepID=UPI003298DE5C
MQKEFEIVITHSSITDKQKKDILAFWEKEGAFSDVRIANKRVEEVIAIAKKGREIVGVSSGVKGIYELMNQRFLFYRSFIGKNHRIKGLSKCLFNATFDYFNEISKSENIIGIFVSFENKMLNNKTRAVVTECHNLTLIGFNEHGIQLRVAYFDEAEIE